VVDMRSIKSLQPTRDGAFSFPTASGFTSFGPAWLSSGRQASSASMKTREKDLFGYTNKTRRRDSKRRSSNTIARPWTHASKGFATSRPFSSWL
jgi:hypothetical protein